MSTCRNLLRPPWPIVQYFIRTLPVLLILSTGALTQSTDPRKNNVCPEAMWKKSFFLRGPSTEAAFINVTHWGYEQARTYFQKNVLQQVMPNIVFTLVAIVLLIIFLLWRMVRQCCLCCSKSECEERRGKADPEKLLTGVGYWMIMIPLYLVSLASLGAMIAGVVLTPRHILTDLHPPLERLIAHLNGTAASMDRLAAGLGDVEPVLSNISYLVNNDINFAALTADIKTLATTLDLPSTSPNAALSTVTNVDNALTGLQTTLNDTRTQLGPAGLGPNVSALSNGLPYWEVVVPAPDGLFVVYSEALLSLNTELSNLNNSNGPSYPTANLSSALAAVPVASWRTTTAALLGALDAWMALRANSGLSNLATALRALQQGMQGLGNDTLPTAAQQLNASMAAWRGAIPAINSLLDRMDYIQSNVALLDLASVSTLTRLRSISQSLANLTALPFSNLTANLSALATDLGAGPAQALEANFGVIQSRLGELPETVLASARGAVQAVSTALSALEPKYDATVAALSNYNANANAATFSVLKSSATAPGATWDLARAARVQRATATSSAASNASVSLVRSAVLAGNLTSLVTAAATNMAAVDVALADTANRTAQRVLGLTPYEERLASMQSLYSKLPTPPSTEFTGLLQALNSFKNFLVTVPAEVRTSVAEATDTVTEGADMLRNKVVHNIDKLNSKSSRPIAKVDDLRHHITIALFCVGALLSGLVIIFAVLHCPWGLGFSITFSLVIAALLFALSSVFATTLVLMQDGCEHVEAVAVKEIGSSNSLQPLLIYYFHADVNVSVSSALRSADIVDVNQVTSQILDTSESIISNLSATYPPQTKLKNIYNSIRTISNRTMANVNIVLDNASLPQIRPLYHDLKGFPCCSMGDYMIKTWLVLTCAAWFLMAAAKMAMSLLGLLDKMLPPNYEQTKGQACSTSCMGCASMTPAVMRAAKNKRNKASSRVQLDLSPGSGQNQVTELSEQQPVSAIVLQPPDQVAAPTRASGPTPEALRPMGSRQSMMEPQLPGAVPYVPPHGSATGIANGGPYGSATGMANGGPYGSTTGMANGGPYGSATGMIPGGPYGSAPGMMPGGPYGSAPGMMPSGPYMTKQG